MNYRTIQRSSASELVMQEIFSSIRSGELKPGGKLPPERELTKMFGVGRSTIREATAALVLVGCLEVIQGRGTFLKNDFKHDTPFSIELSNIQAATHILNLIEVREILECNAVRLAARRADTASIRQIQSALSQMKAAVGDIQSFSQLDFDFHVTLARSTGNEMIHEMMKWILEKVHQEYEHFKPKILFQTDKAVATAEQVLFCVVKREEDEAARFMHDHLNLVTTEVIRMMPGAKLSKKQKTEIDSELTAINKPPLAV